MSFFIVSLIILEVLRTIYESHPSDEKETNFLISGFRKFDTALHDLCSSFYRIDFNSFLRRARSFSSVFLVLTVFAYIYTGKDYSHFFAYTLIITLYLLDPEEDDPRSKSTSYDPFTIISAVFLLIFSSAFLALWMLGDSQWMQISGVISREITPDFLSEQIQQEGLFPLYASFVFSLTCLIGSLFLSFASGLFIYPFRLLISGVIYFIVRTAGTLARKTSPYRFACVFFVALFAVKDII